MAQDNPVSIEESYLGETEDENLRNYLREYYGQTIEKTEDLEQEACCADNTAQKYKSIIDLIPPEVVEKNYGCGCTIPEDDLTGLKVLDLGSGSGLDAYIVSHLVGQDGFVHGIDMTDEQLDVARRNIAPTMAAFGFDSSNVQFHKAYIETCEPIESNSIDLVISDCVVNLSPLKHRVIQTAYRVLKEGGEIYISDIVADRRVPEAIQQNKKLVAECLGGALYENDWLDILEDAGFKDPRIIEKKPVDQDVLGIPIQFYSVTVRAFKFKHPLDRRCEDYGQFATYKGSIKNNTARYTLDDHHVFEARRPAAVCRNTARMLSETRLGQHFTVTPAIEHFGLFPCGPGDATDGVSTSEPCC